MSAISLKSITGITSITAPAGFDNQLTLHTNNTTERLKIDVAGNVHVNNHLAVAGVTTFAENVIVQKELSFADSPYIGGTIPPNSLRFGNNDDLILYHTGNYSGIDERGGGTGGLVLHCTNNFTVKGNASNKLRIKAIEGGAVELYHNNVQKLTTTSSGVSVTGAVALSEITSTASSLSIHNTADRVLIKGTNRIDIADDMVRFQNRAQGAALLEAVAGASGYVKLYHNNNVVASVTLDALTVTGRTSNSGMVEIASNQGANNNDRFRIHKTSAASRLTIQEYSSGSWVENIRITGGGAVELKHSNGTTKFQTTSTGAQVTTASSANSVKNITTSTSTPSGGSDGDLWFTYVA